MRSLIALAFLVCSLASAGLEDSDSAIYLPKDTLLNVKVDTRILPRTKQTSLLVDADDDGKADFWEGGQTRCTLSHEESEVVRILRKEMILAVNTVARAPGAEFDSVVLQVKTPKGATLSIQCNYRHGAFDYIPNLERLKTIFKITQPEDVDFN